MDSLQLRVEYKAVEPSAEPTPTGFVRLEHGASSAILLTPDEIDEHHADIPRDRDVILYCT